jgi:DNA (cytosine-5)-methyltransferase 1
MVKTYCEIIQTDEIKSAVEKTNEEKLNEIKPIIKNAEINNINMEITENANISKMNKKALINKCKELGIKKYSSKKKSQLIELINNYNKTNNSANNVNNEITINKESENTIVFSDNQHNTKPTNAETINTETPIKFIDLFCGIGGFHQALKNINGECVFACDIDEKCRKSYEENYGILPESDITKINIDEIPPFDILCAGFPCQPFSKAGFQKGFNDNRGNLFFNICDIVKKHKPKYLLLENVRNLSSHDDGNTWKVIYENIDSMGYYTYKMPAILNVLHFNVPQNRERVIIMCKRKDLGELQMLPIIPDKPKTNLTKYIKDFICDKKDTEKYIIDGKMRDVETVWDLFIKLLIKNNIDMPKFPIWTDWWDNTFESNDAFYLKYKSWIDKNRLFYNDNKKILENWLKISRKNENWFGAVRKFEWQAGDLMSNDSMKNVLWSARGSGIRVKRCDYIPTLVAMSMIPVYGPESRKLSPRELLRLQSFPDTFKFNEKNIYKQIGNSVNVKMIERCARFLILNENLF